MGGIHGTRGTGWEAAEGGGTHGEEEDEVEILRGKMATVLDFTVKRVPFSCNVAHPCA